MTPRGPLGTIAPMNEEFEVVIEAEDRSHSHTYSFGAWKVAEIVASAFRENGFTAEVREVVEPALD